MTEKKAMTTKKDSLPAIIDLEKLAGQGFFSRNRLFAGGILLTSKPVKT